MTKHNIDNSLRDFGKVVLWQYDKAYNLLRILSHMEEVYGVSVSKFWDSWNHEVIDIDNCSEFGASLWSFVLGIKRPYIVQDGKKKPISLNLFRKFIKASFFISSANSSIPSINRYLSYMFTVYGTLSAITVVDNLDMSIDYKVDPGLYAKLDEETRLFYEQNKDIIEINPLGIKSNEAVEEIVFSLTHQEDFIPKYETFQEWCDRTGADFDPYARQFWVGEIIKHDDGIRGLVKWECVADVKGYLNTGWEAVKNKFKVTDKGRPLAGGLCPSITGDEYRVGKRYFVGDIVKHAGESYVCTEGVLSKENTGFGSCINKFRSMKYSANTGYYTGDVVLDANGEPWVLSDSNYTTYPWNSYQVPFEHENVKKVFTKAFNKTTLISDGTLIKSDPEYSHILGQTTWQFLSTVGIEKKDEVSYNDLLLNFKVSETGTIADIIDKATNRTEGEKSKYPVNGATFYTLLTDFGIVFSPSDELQSLLIKDGALATDKVSDITSSISGTAVKEDEGVYEAWEVEDATPVDVSVLALHEVLDNSRVAYAQTTKIGFIANLVEISEDRYMNDFINKVKDMA